MSELDIEPLKQQIRETALSKTPGVRTGVFLPRADWHAIIAALQDRERLRAAIHEILVLSESGTSIRQIARAALEDRDV